MRSRTSSASSFSSDIHPSRPRPRSQARTRRTGGSTRDVDYLGSIGKLFRLTLLAVVLAVVFPYLRGYLFASGNRKVVGNNATQPFQGLADAVNAGVDIAENAFADVLHTRPSKGDLSTAVIPPTAARTQPQPRKSHPQHHNNNDDNSNGTSLAITFLTLLPSILYTMLQFLSIPFSYLFSLLYSLFTSIFSYSRFALSHTLRPVTTAFAPLTYLISGLVFIFISTPLNLIDAVVREFYPVYIFLGAATVVGLAMGLGAAAVLYITAFVFVDRVKEDNHSLNDSFARPSKQVQDESVRLSPQTAYHGGPAAGYFANPTSPSYTSSASPLVSPTTPYRRHDNYASSPYARTSG